MAISVDRIVGTENDVGDTATQGRNLTEVNFSGVLKAVGVPLLGTTNIQRNYVVYGCKPSIGSGLTVDIAVGEMMINGFWVALNATGSTIDVNASETDAAWYVQLTTSAGLVTGVTTVRVLSPAFDGSDDPANAVKLFHATSDSTTVTSLTGYRRRMPGALFAGNYTGSGAGQTVDLDFRPHMVLVHGDYDTNEQVIGIGWDWYDFTNTPVGWSSIGAVGGTVITSTSNAARPLIDEDGFTVGNGAADSLDRGAQVYHYFAWA